MYQTIKLLFKTIFFLPLKIDLVRHDDKTTKPRIFISNHPSTFDSIFVLISLVERVVVLITKNAFNVPIVGFLLTKSGHIPVEDNNGRGAYEESLRRLKIGQNLLVFPEHWSGNISDKKPKFYSGAARLAMETGIPIVPIGTSPQKDKIISKKMIIKGNPQYAKFFFYGRYNITVGKSVKIPKQEINKASIKKYNEQLRKEIYTLVKESEDRHF